MKKSKSYHLDIRAHRKNPYGLLRHSYREDGKVKKETIGNITGLSLEKLHAMRAPIQGKPSSQTLPAFTKKNAHKLSCDPTP